MVIIGWHSVVVCYRYGNEVDFLHASRPGLGTLNFEQQFATPSLDELEADRPAHAFYAPG